uniref:Ig-like domain-containing protein n=1 Tax=Latimeria chalumnae TaxID=7897 RepID=H2ZUJ6_LATCH
ELFPKPHLEVPSGASLTEGDSATLKCNVQSNPRDAPLQYSFYKDGEKLNSDAVHQSQYTLGSIEMKDTGSYTCEAKAFDKNIKKESQTRQISVEEQELFQTPTLTASPGLTPVDESSFSLICTVPERSVKKNTTLYYSFYKEADPLTNRSISETYQIPVMALNHTGQYMCSAETWNRAVRKESAAIYIQVQGVPVSGVSLWVKSPVGDIIEGDSIVLLCSVTAGSLPITFTWGRQDDRQKSKELKSQSRELSIPLSSMKESHSGVYTCWASNREGNETATSKPVTVTVQTPVSGINISANIETPEIQLGQSLMLNCSVTRGSSPSFTWYHNGQKIQAPQDHYRLSQRDSARLDHGGSYQCTAEN